MKSPISATKADSLSTVFRNSEQEIPTAGLFAFERDEKEPSFSSIVYICPCGCGELSTLPVSTGLELARRWRWDGNVDVPTLQPSIRRLNGCRFHGFLTNGQWSFCDDSGR